MEHSKKERGRRTWRKGGSQEHDKEWEEYRVHKWLLMCSKS